MNNIKVYPLGILSKPSSFCDILSKEIGHVACVVSLENNHKRECVIWDKEGFPDIYVKNKKITFTAVKKALKLLEKNPRNKLRYNLIKKNYMEAEENAKVY